MIRIGTIWDRTTEVIGGRLDILAAIATLLLFGPNVVQAVLVALAGPSGALATVAALLGLVVLVLTIWGTLALTAVASDPAVDRARGIAIGRDRLGAGLAVLLVVVVVTIVASLPGVILLVASGFDMERARQGLDQTDMDFSRAGMAILWFFLLTLVGLWFSARMVPLFAVVVNERRGLGAFARAFALTRGSTIRLIGVMILYAIVILVVLAATTTVFGLIFRLILGPESPGGVRLVTSIVSAVVTAAFAILQNAFSAQFYLAARDRDGAIASA